MSENVKASELSLPPAAHAIGIRTSFHWQDGWWFTRDDDGAVIIEHWNETSDKEAGERAAIKLKIPGSEWCSIVASVSQLGETSVSWSVFKALHGDWPDDHEPHRYRDETDDEWPIKSTVAN